MHFLNGNVWIRIKISLKFVPKCPIDNIPALVQIMAWRRPGDKPLSEPMMVSLLTHICVIALGLNQLTLKHTDKMYTNLSVGINMEIQVEDCYTGIPIIRIRLWWDRLSFQNKKILDRLISFSQNIRHLFQAVFCLKLEFQTSISLQNRVTFSYGTATRLMNRRRVEPLVEIFKVFVHI